MECCKNCKRASERLRSDGENAYCGHCYGKVAIVRCAACDQVITSGVQHGDDFYHPRCFTCAVCGKCLAREQFLMRNNGRFCCDCYERAFSEKCAKCGLTFSGVGDIFYIFYDKRPWHAECFACRRCGNSLLGKLTVAHAGDIYCTTCAPA